MASQLVSDDSLARRLGAMAFGERRALLDRLLIAHNCNEPDQTITSLATATGTNRFTASRHLAVLREAGLVTVDIVGTRRLHRIDLEGVASIDDWLYPFVDAYQAAFSRNSGPAASQIV